MTKPMNFVPENLWEPCSELILLIVAYIYIDTVFAGILASLYCILYQYLYAQISTKMYHF